MLDNSLLHQLMIVNYQSTSLQLQSCGPLDHPHHHLCTPQHQSFLKNHCQHFSSIRLLSNLCRTATTNRCYSSAQRMYVGCKIKMSTYCGNNKKPCGGEFYPFLSGPFASIYGRSGCYYHQHIPRVYGRNI